MAVFDNMNKSTSPGLAPGVVEYYERKLLENMKAELVHSRDAQKRNLPLHNGKRVQFRRFTPFDPVTTPLSEGVTPNGQTLRQTAFWAMVKPYGAHVELTDEADLYLLDHTQKETARLLSDQAALSLDTISRNALHAGLNVQYANGKASRSALGAADVLTYAEIKKTVRTLKRRNVKPFDDGFYHAIVHPDTVHDLTSDAMWTDVSKYQDKQKTEKYELGTIFKVKFYESTNAMVFRAGTHVFGDVTKLSISGVDETGKALTITAEQAKITPDVARELAGKLLYLKNDHTSAANDTLDPVCVEYVDATDGKSATVHLRWALSPATVAKIAAEGYTSTLEPYGGGAGGAEVFSTLIYGRDAFGCVELGGNGKNVEVIINPPGSAGASDPLSQRGTIAWKVKGFCTTILQDDFIVRIEHGATA